MRRFFVPVRSTIRVFDHAYRQSLLLVGVAALPYTAKVSCPSLGQTIQILRVVADRRVRPHKMAYLLRFMTGLHQLGKKSRRRGGLPRPPAETVMNLCATNTTQPNCRFMSHSGLG